MVEDGSTTENYTQVTSLSNITAGTYIIINANYYLPSTTTNTSPTKVAAPTITSGTIATTNVTSAMIWYFTGTSYSAMTIKNAAGSYLYATNSSTGLRVGATSDTWTFATNGSAFSLKEANNSRYCATYAAGSNWRSYTSATSTNYGDGGRVYLYKLTTTANYTTYYTTSTQLTVTAVSEDNSKGTAHVSAL